MTRPRLVGLLTLSLLLLAATAARALESAPSVSRHVTASLVSDTDAYEPGKPFRLGLRLQLAPGWHVYWRNPGDAGIPPELTLTLPAGSTAGDMQWPAPVRLPEGPAMTYSYTGEVVLPVGVTPGAGPGALDVAAKAEWLVCKDICVPEEGAFALSLPPGAPAPSAQAALFAAADARMPRPSPFTAQVGAGAELDLAGAGLSRASVQDAWFFPSAWGAVDQAAPQPFAVREGGLTMRLQPGPTFDAKAALTGLLVLRDASGQESYLDVSAAPGAVPPAEAAVPLARALLFAVLGGLVLNLMPCVFPVLAIKAMALARLSGRARGEVRSHALSYTAGVVVSFGLLGAALIGLRAAGGAVDWGFQFQTPAFVAATAWLLFAVGLNLSGVFEFGGSLAGSGQSLLTGRQGHLASALTGLLAVVVATPCTAPFMAVAIGAALAAPAPAALGVFLAMGAGMALPYAALAAVPRLADRLPRPGAWMEVLRGVLAFPMYGAAAWLAWVVAQEAGAPGVLATGAGLVLLGFAAWALGRTQRGMGPWRRVGQAAAVAACAGALAMLPGLSVQPLQAADVTTGPAEPFTTARLAALRAEGRPVFVDMTAAWCITCLVNERVAIDTGSVQRAFTARRVAYLKGDWTRKNPEITAFLRENGRSGVPLYVYYPPSAGPVILPQVLTAGALLDQVDPNRS